LQGLYQFLVGKGEAGAIDAFTRDLSGFHKCDSAHYDALLHGCIEQSQELDALIEPQLDRRLAELSPIEHACMWMGAFEFLRCPDVPWRVVLNEYIELAKDFGGTDGHKYVNAVLNGMAPRLRPHETGTLKATLQGHTGLTPYVRLGGNAPVLGLSLALLAIGTLPSRLRWPGAAARRKRRHRRP